MAKRKEISGKASNDGSVDSEGDTDMLDVEFEWFDPADVDFHGLKQLLKQLFDADNEAFDISELADLIISQPEVGSTVKVTDDENEAKDNDPFAFLTALNLHTHRQHDAIKQLKEYLSAKATSGTGHDTSSIASLLNASSPDTQVGLILNDRFINMPAQIFPPMYNMLLEEMADAVADKKPFNFTHFVIVSRSFTEIESQLPDADDEQPAKKKKKGKGGSASDSETFYFHPEDEIWKRHASAYATYAYTKEVDPGSSDAKRAFHEAGIKPTGLVMLIEAPRFPEAIKDIEAYIGGTAASS